MASTKAPPICFVCNKPILDDECFRMPDDQIRHKKCRPGSKAWNTRFPESAKHPITSLLANAGREKPAPKTADPLRAKVKAFVGRVRYMVYMDGVDKTANLWTISNLEIGTHGLICNGPYEVCRYVNNQPITPVQPIDTLLERLYEALTKPE